MIEEPIQRKFNAYPKDFTPSAKHRAVRTDTKNSHQEEFSFSARKPNYKRMNYSTQLNQDNKEQGLHNLFTINPEDMNKRHASLAEREKPISNNHRNKRMPYINPELLNQARMEQNSQKQLHCIGETDIQSSLTPGSIRKNQINLQTPLNQEAPAHIERPNRQATSNKKLEDNQNIFQNSLRSQYLNYTSSKAQKLAHLGRIGGSEAQGKFKTVKKNFSFSDTQKDGLNNSHLLLKRGISEQKQTQRKKLLGFGYLLEQKKVNQLKQHINFMATQKTKSKNQIQLTQQTQPDIQFMSRTSGFNAKSMRKRKIKGMNARFYPQLGQSSIREQSVNGEITYIEHQDSEIYGSRSVPKYFDNHNRSRRIKISYKTSLNNLKDIFQTLKRHNSVSLELTVPNILMNLKISPHLDKTSLYNQACQIFSGLGIPLHHPTVKRYSNCVLMVNKHISVLVHYNSKIYLGGWQAEYLDQGVKHGLGLEWVPNSYVYYGEFANNKRQGLGVMKTNDESFMGIWRRNKRTNEGLCISRSGQIEQLSSRGSGQVQWNEEEECYEEDPFLC